MTRPRVVVADDAPLIRQGVRELLVRGGCDVVGEAGSISEVDGLLLTGEPFDVLVLDIRMPPTHTDEGVVLLERLRAAGSTLGVLLLSMYASPSLALRAMSAGHGTGYLLKAGLPMVMRWLRRCERWCRADRWSIRPWCRWWSVPRGLRRAPTS
jgi:DNA-binding NarL/FixJ family response regulator